MAAVAPGLIPHSAGFYRPEKMAEHRPSFTAVNEPTVNAPAASNDSHPLVASHQPSPDTANTEVKDTAPAQKIEHASKENRATIADEHREDNARPNPESKMTPAPLHSSTAAPTPNSGLAPITRPSDNPAPAPTGPQHHMPQQSDKPEHRRKSVLSDILSPAEPSQPPTNNSVAGSQKRKRSISTERQHREHSRLNQLSPPRSPKSGRMAYTAENGANEESISPRQTFPPPPSDQHRSQAGSGSFGSQASSGHAYPPPPDRPTEQTEAYPRANGASRDDYEPPLDPSIAPSQDRPYYSESHLAEALQRENRSYEAAPPRDEYPQSEEPVEEQQEEQQEQGQQQQQQFGTYGGSREAGTADIDRKRRKRIFSNRTKTGCMTCRRRKKKCDETHPECNNCLRGGFVCEGYSVRGTWQKPANSKQPVPLQSKNGFPSQEGNASRTAYPAMSRYQDSVSDYSRNSSISGPNPQYDTKRESISEHDGVFGRTSPPSQKTQPSWVKSSASQPYPSNPPDASKYRGSEHRGSIYDITQEREEGSSMPPPPQGHRSGSVSTQYSQSALSANANNSPPQRQVPPQAQAQAAAQAALTQVSGRNRNQYTEREKMLLGYYFYPNTPALIEDRERCIAAIWRFNNATNPSHGASPEERIRLFRQILSMKPSPEPPLSSGEIPPSSLPLPVGKCGERVIVEAPFHCDYGYNIEIGNDVLIGADCRFSDHCQVKIGDRCILSPGVKLICATYPIDPRRRCGSGGAILGRSIIIEEDCWIGAGTTILAGVRVGKSSTVGAGSLVHQNVPRFTVAAGNPAKVSRGIYDGEAE